MSQPRATLTPWRKVIWLAVPLVVLLTFFCTACQFTEPEFQFIPKDAKVVRNYVGERTSIARWGSPIPEFTAANWPVDYREDLKRMVREIEGKGYHEQSNSTGTLSSRFFLHRNGDQIYIQPHWEKGEEVSGATLPQSVRFNYIHTEDRPLHCLSKSLMKVIDRTVIHRPKYR